MSGAAGARDFLEALTGYSDAPADGYTPSKDRPARIGTVDPAYSGTGNAKVTFDGETVMGTRTYVPLVPVLANDRVVLLPVGRSYVIVGDLGGSLEDTLDGLAVGYRLVQTVYFTSSGSFAKASYPWLRAIRVRVQAGGGAGGSSSTATGANHSKGAGGGGGGYAEAFITDVAGLASSVTVTRGAGGSGASGGLGGFGPFVISGPIRESDRRSKAAASEL